MAAPSSQSGHRPSSTPGAILRGLGRRRGGSGGRGGGVRGVTRHGWFCFVRFFSFSVLLHSILFYSVLFCSVRFLVEADDGGREEDCALRGRRCARHGYLYLRRIPMRTPRHGFVSRPRRPSWLPRWKDADFRDREFVWDLGGAEGEVDGAAETRGMRGRGDEMTSFHCSVFCLRPRS
jgi:hypothetical protein